MAHEGSSPSGPTKEREYLECPMIDTNWKETMSASKNTYTVVSLAWEGDGVTALYQGDQLIEWGDYYHDKIDDVIDGIFKGLDLSNCEYTRRSLSISDEHFDVVFDEIPESLNELTSKYEYTETSQ